MYGLNKAVCCSKVVVGVQGWDAYPMFYKVYAYMGYIAVECVWCIC